MIPVYERSKYLTDVPTSYCPGCMHGIATKLIAEVIDEMGIGGKTVICESIGCSYNLFKFLDLDFFGGAHGRAPAVATAFKRLKPDVPLIVYQGDGDCASIGMGETIHAASRGENFTVIMVNNQVYGMTGGQQAATTLIGQKTTTTPYGRDAESTGYPIKVAEIVATLEAPKYVARFALDTPKHILQAKKGIRRALEVQIYQKGYSYVELLSACPTNWKIDPKDGPAYMQEKVFPIFPLGVFKNVEEEAK